MADRPVTKTRRITREELARFLPSHRAIKAFEDLIEDLQSLPDSIASTSDDQDTILAGATYRPHVPVPVHNPDDSSSQILATQIFGG